jgi:ribonucleoside-diphosphate reductase alpha chain
MRDVMTKSSHTAPAKQELGALKEKNAIDRFTVVKRNGSIVPFRRDRIHRAIDLAFHDTRRIPFDTQLEELDQLEVEKVTDQVMDLLLTQATKGASLTVEGIQDMVEVNLMNMGHQDVARDYIIYREQHTHLREDSPQNLKVHRKDGTLVRFNPMKIATSIEESFRRAGHIEGQTPASVIDSVNDLTQKIVDRAVALHKTGEHLHVATMQDEVEHLLMKEGYYLVAKDYILSRASIELPTPEEKPTEGGKREFTVISTDDTTKVIKESFLRNRIKTACRNLKEVSVDDRLETLMLNFYEGIKEQEVDQAGIMAARMKIEVDPAYSKVAARLLCDMLYRESMDTSASDTSLENSHRNYFKKYINFGISVHRLSPDLLQFDLDKLGKAMDLKRDDLFSYLGIQTLYDRYFIHHEERRLETPQIFWMRVAMGLALCEGDQKNERAIEFYNLLSQFLFTSATPTLFNSGTMHSQLSSCYLSTVMDDLSHIFKVVADDAQLSKWAGGIGNDWTNVRATGSVIKGTNGKSQGIIPFLKVANDTAVAVNQCFAPDTLIYTSKGIVPISEVKVGNLVLGTSGKYREVTETFAYNQHDAMVAVTPKHSLYPIVVTAGHPFFAIRDVPEEQAISRTLGGLKKGKLKAEWIEAGQLQKGDYIAQVIPQEVVAVPEFTEEDARLYGILLGDGHMSKNGAQWGVSGKSSEYLEFVRSYLKARGIPTWETERNEHYMQINWAVGRGAVRDATSGRIVGSGALTLPFEHSDLYDDQGRKHIAPRLSHLPRSQTLAMIQGLIETDGNISHEKEVTFCNTSQPLVEGLRYQLLRMGIPTAGKIRKRKNNHKGKRCDGSEIHFKGETICYDIRIPATAEIAERVGFKTVTKKNWFIHNQYLFTRIKKQEQIPTVPFVYDLKVDIDESYMTTAGLAHNGGKRKGAMCAYLETWHLDIEDFLELRKNTGDDRRRTHDMNTANWIPDLFMKRVSENGHWTLFSPSDTPDLHDLYGSAFEKRYMEYEKMAETGKLKLHKKMEAVEIWRKMLSMLFETGHPWITFKDPSNIRSPQDHVGVVHSSNLCTEILLNTSKEETAVCNLGSINMELHCTPDGIDEKKLAYTIKTAMRMLDNVIDINFYPITEAESSNAKHRPVGLGMMGFQDALYIQDISYASHEAVEFADKSMEMISYYAILASTELAKERGTYSTYKGSKWDRGLLPIDTLDLLAQERGGYLEVDRQTRMDWNVVRSAIKKHGMRNSNTMAIAPTATISNITGITQSIEPMYKHLFVKSNLSGEFTVPNLYLAEKLKKLGLWDQEMLDDLKYFDGSIAEIERIPEDVKRVYLTAFEIDPEWIIECASRRQKWIDMGQSLNLYIAEPSGKRLHQMYMLSWVRGLKTNYYLRSVAATQIEKSTTDINKRGLQPRWMKSKSASSNIKIDREEPVAPKACRIGDETCESCQ